MSNIYRDRTRASLGGVSVPNWEVTGSTRGIKEKGPDFRAFLGSGDPTFIVGRHSVRFGDGLECAKCLHPVESRHGMRGGRPSGETPDLNQPPTFLAMGCAAQRDSSLTSAWTTPKP